MATSYERSVTIDPKNNPLAWHFLGIHYKDVGNKEAAIRNFEGFLKHYPDDSGDMVLEAKAALAELR
jgi:tetratricopeptide (TPR) repeat protein